MATVAAGEGIFAQAAFGAAPADNVVVVISQRGGADGISLVVPHGDPWYYKHRPHIGVPRSRVLGLDSMFGLHPALKELYALWRSRNLAIVHAAGLPHPNRSHFDAIAEIEDAAPGTSIRTGWINRTLALDPHRQAIDAVQLGSTQAPYSFGGSSPTLALPDLSSVGWPSWITQQSAWRDAYRSAHRSLWTNYTGLGAAEAQAAFATQDALMPTSAATYKPRTGVTYPTSTLGTTLTQVARLIKADLGTRVVTVDSGAWDFHTNIGTLAGGQMLTAARDFSACIDAFVKDLGSTWMKRVTIITMTEFGRRVQENGDKGADHGWGQAMFAIGAGVRGGHVYGRWPGLAPTHLTSGDLTVTTDYRRVLAEVLQQRMGTDPHKVLPGFRFTPLGMIHAG